MQDSAEVKSLANEIAVQELREDTELEPDIIKNISRI